MDTDPHGSTDQRERVETAEASKPPQLCRWTIHYECDIEYEDIPEPEGPSDQIDLANPPNWPKWPSNWTEPPFQTRLVDNLESNDFSTIGVSELPVAVPQIVKAAAKSPDVLLREALGFAIMARNVKLVGELCAQFSVTRAEIGDLYPFHLAIAYLDGALSCCNVLDLLLSSRFGSMTWHALESLCVDNFGHTLLDSLMIAVLKSHSSISPGVVDGQLRNESHFPGEEVDICGRWDVDSELFRARLRRGQPTIPRTWKHKFCHTSVQAICHCVELIGEADVSVNSFFMDSGLYLTHCSGCGLKMQLGHLHALVMTAFHLANAGFKDEDLFGMVALCVTMIGCGLMPSIRAHVAAGALFDKEFSTVGCAHELITPAELASRAPAAYIKSWPTDVQVGWEVFCRVLQLGEATPAGQQSDPKDQDDDDEDQHIDALSDDEELGHFCCEHSRREFQGEALSVISAAVRAELVTYRRIREQDSWTSENFNMAELLTGLQEGSSPLSSIGWHRKELLKPFCRCGRFFGGNYYTSAGCACVHYVSNMDDWSRTQFIPFSTWNFGVV
jgi:hypothetical protein